MGMNVERYRPLVATGGVSAATAQIGGKGGGDAIVEGFPLLLTLSTDLLNSWCERDVALSDRVISLRLPLVDGELDYMVLSVQSQADESDAQRGTRGAHVDLRQTDEVVHLLDGVALPVIHLTVGDWHERSVEADAIGLGVSKVGGMPCWLQEPLMFPGYEFILQLEEFELVQQSPAYGDVFGGGIGYLFLETISQAALRGNGRQHGIFFVQYS